MPVMTAARMQVKKVFLLALHGVQNSLTTGCITNVTQEGGGEANAENITLQEGDVQRSCPGTIQFYSILPVQLACNKLMLQVQSGYGT